MLFIIAVMFTFSFGSAFAATAQEAFADSYSATIGDQYFESLWEDIVEVTTSSSTIDMTADVTWAIDKTVVDGFKADAKALYDYYMLNTAEGYVVNGADLLNVVLNFDGDVADTTKQEALKIAIAAAQFDADKAEALAVLATVPTYNYSAEVMSDADAIAAQSETLGTITFVDKDYTYAAAAEKLVDYFEGKVEDCDDFNADATVGSYKAASETANAVVAGAVLPMGYATYTDANEVNAMALTGSYDLKVAYAATSKTAKTAAAGYTFPVGAAGGLFLDVNKDVNLWSTASVETAGKIDAANVAAAKAQNAAYYAAYVTAHPTDVKYADKWLKVADLLAENGRAVQAPDGSKYAYKADAMADLEYDAARHGAEKNADGELVRDAADVQDYLEDGLYEIAIAADRNAVDAAYTAARANIINAKSAVIADKLAFVKESVKKAAEMLVADYTEDEVFYAKELAKVQKYVDTYMAKVDAAATRGEVETAYETMLSKIDDVDTAAELDAEWIAAMGGTGVVADLYNAAGAYVTYYNNHISVVDTNADLVPTVLKARLAEMIGESGFRTNAEIKTLKDKAVEVAQGLPTGTEIKAAKKAVEAAVKALPAKATVADFAAIQAVSDVIDAYVDLNGSASGLTLTGYNTAITQIVNAYNSQYAKELATVKKTDEAAIKAIRSEIYATIVALGELEEATADTTYMANVRSILQGYLNEIYAEEVKAIEKAIAAIPINVTEADKATVVKARELYDAYVAKHTSKTSVYYATSVDFVGDAYTAPADYLAGYVEFAIGTLTEAETVLGLNAEDEAYSVEALKITAKSSVKKGAITVKWSVEGDTDAVEGYEVYRSVKKNSGFGTKPFFTTTKTSYKNTKNLKAGTRYYFKVRAFATTEEGVKVYSDWSNKAYRVAK